MVSLVSLKLENISTKMKALDFNQIYFQNERNLIIVWTIKTKSSKLLCQRALLFYWLKVAPPVEGAY